MRDHVAAACNLTKTKIGRLHAIRSNLHKDLLALFDRGDLVEDVAYQLSRFPMEIQEALADKLLDGRKHKMPIGSTVGAVYANLEGLQKPMSCRAHAGGPDCHHLTGRIVHSLGQQYSWAICNPGQCCMDCYKAKEGCSGACREARDRAKVEKAAEEEKKAEREKDAEIAQRVLKSRIRERSEQLLSYAESAGLKDDDKISSNCRSATVAQLRKWASGDMEGEHFYGDECVKPAWAKDAAEMARRLGCSLELAMGLPEKNAQQPPVGEPLDWLKGAPCAVGWYAAKVRMFNNTLPVPRVFWWDGEIWIRDREKNLPIDRAYTVTGWLPLPEVKG
jgi:ParB family chromosome partitioning protein